MIRTSKKYQVNWRDIGQGLLVAIGTDALGIIYKTVEAGSLDFNWRNVLLAGLGAGISYLGKKFFTPSQTIVNNDTPT